MSKILAIDDNRDNLIVLEAYLKQYLPMYKIIKAYSGKEGIKLAFWEQPDLILLDINMPEMNGFTACQELKKNNSTRHIPIIMLTAIYTDIESKVRGLELGADAFLSKPFQPAELISQIKAMIRIKKAEDRLRVEKNLLQDLVKKRTRALENAQQAAILTIARIIEIKDPYISGKYYQVANLSKAIGEKMGMSGKQLEGLWFASLIYNVGKLAIPVDILNKPGKLTEIEFNFIKEHTRSAYEMLKDLPYPWPIAKIILQHHENIDGSGYPDGLKGNEIFLEARILRVADTVVSMLSHRSYRAAFTIEEVLEELKNKSGIYYDSEIVNICIGLLENKNFFINNDN
jgi:putative two-component system response regulator